LFVLRAVCKVLRAIWMTDIGVSSVWRRAFLTPTITQSIMTCYAPEISMWRMQSKLEHDKNKMGDLRYIDQWCEVMGRTYHHADDVLFNGLTSYAVGAQHPYIGRYPGSMKIKKPYILGQLSVIENENEAEITAWISSKLVPNMLGYIPLITMSSFLEYICDHNNHGLRVLEILHDMFSSGQLATVFADRVCILNRARAPCVCRGGFVY
jgi:hypothetical protein